MAISRASGSPRSSFLLVLAILAMLAVPAALTLHTVRVAPQAAASVASPSPYGYTVSLLLFIVPILVIGLWFVPREGVRISKRSFVRTIAILFPMGVILDFFFARSFLKFPDPGATLGIAAPALGGSVPVEEYLFYFTGFVAVLLLWAVEGLKYREIADVLDMPLGTVMSRLYRARTSLSAQLAPLAAEHGIVVEDRGNASRGRDRAV